MRNLYKRHREPFYEALMGAIILVPEGLSDFEWLCLWQRVAETSDEVAKECALTPITVIPTSDAAIADTITEIARFRPDAIALVDGDGPGNDYIACLEQSEIRPTKIIQYGTAAAIECLSAWILEPALSISASVLSGLLPPGEPNLRNLQAALILRKEDRQMREDLCWAAAEIPACAMRAGRFLEDVAHIASGVTPKDPNWTVTIRPSGVSLFKAMHVSRV